MQSGGSVSQKEKAMALLGWGDTDFTLRSDFLQQQTPQGKPPQRNQRVIQQLGKGGMGKTQLVQGQDKKRAVRKTVFNPKYNQNLKHQFGILQFLKQISPDDTRFVKALRLEFQQGKPASFTMQISEGFLSLDKIFKRNLSLSSECRLSIAKGVIKAVRFLHSIDIVHNDIKPSNILVNPDTCEIQLIDFGSAHIKKSDSFYTFQGTPAYLRPDLPRINRREGYTFNEMKENDLWAAYLVAEQVLENQSQPKFLRDIPKQNYNVFNLRSVLEQVYRQNTQQRNNWLSSLKRTLRQ